MMIVSRMLCDVIRLCGLDMSSKNEMNVNRKARV